MCAYPLDCDILGNTKPTKLIDPIQKPQNQGLDPIALISTLETINRKTQDLQNQKDQIDFFALTTSLNIIKNHMHHDLNEMLISQLMNSETLREDILFLFHSFSSKIYIPSLCELLEELSSIDANFSSHLFPSDLWPQIKLRFENPDEILSHNLIINEQNEEKQNIIKQSALYYFCHEEGIAQPEDYSNDFFEYMLDDPSRFTIRKSLLGLIGNLTFFEVLDFESVQDIFQTLMDYYNKDYSIKIKYMILSTLNTVLYKIIQYINTNQPILISMINPSIPNLILSIFNENDPNIIERSCNLFNVFLILKQIDGKTTNFLMKLIDFFKNQSENFLSQENTEENKDEQFDDYFDNFNFQYSNDDEEIDYFSDARISAMKSFLICFQFDEMRTIITDLIDWDSLWKFVMHFKDESFKNEQDFFISMICSFISTDPSVIPVFHPIFPKLLNYFDNTTHIIQELIFSSMAIARESFTIDLLNAMIECEFLDKISALALFSPKDAIFYAQIFEKIYSYVHSSPTKEKQYSYAIKDITTLQEIVDEAEDNDEFSQASELCSILLSYYDN